MKKKQCVIFSCAKAAWKSKTLLKMKLTTLILLIGIMQSFAIDSYAQKMRLDLKIENMSVKRVLNQIEDQSEFFFLYNSKLIDVNRRVDIMVEDGTIDQILSELFGDTNVGYKVVDRQIVLTNKDLNENNEQQQKKLQVTGSVTDQSGTQLPGVTVVIKGTSQGAVTNSNGQYTLSNVAPDATLVFSFIGMKTQAIPVSGKAKIDVILTEESIGIDEVVAIGFGTQKKINLTGAVGFATSAELESRPVTNATQAIQGLIPGLKITTNTGQLDRNMNISIRGTGTIGSSSGSPLILIDGMEGDIHTINPQDIESISVLKDASASSIYGSRAPFGVILVTTKNGKKGTTTLNYNNNYRVSSPMGLPQSMDSYSFAAMMNESLKNSGRSARFTDETMQKMLDYQAGKIAGGIDPSDSNPDAWSDVWALGYANTDIYNELYRSNVLSQTHNISASGGSENMTFYASFNYLNEGGLIKIGDDGLNRYNVTGKFTSVLTDWLKFNMTARFTRNNVWRPRTFNDWFYNVYGRQNWPNIPMYDPNGKIYGFNAVDLERGGVREAQTDQHFYQANFIIEPVKRWITNVEFNYRILGDNAKETTLRSYQEGPNGDPIYTINDSGLYQEQRKENYLNLNVYSEYSRSFNQVHNFKIMGGFQLEELTQNAFNVYKNGLIIPGLPELNLTNGLLSNGTSQDAIVKGYGNEWATAGVFGRMNYDYKGRYLAEINMRYDGSSRFRQGNRWQTSPSFSAGWNISQEDFWEPLKKTANLLKFRFSYGELGNQNTNSWYPTYRAMNIGSLNGGWLQGGSKPNTAAIGSLISTALTWESVSTWNIGLDYGLFDNRLSGSADYFTRYTKNMVGPAPELPNTLGISAPQTNNCDLQTKGWEVSLSWKDKLNNGLNYGVNLSLSDQITYIDSYPSNRTNSLGSYISGQQDGLIWGFETIGIAKTQAEMDEHLATVDQSAIGSQWGAGDIMYRDLNGDNKITSGANTLDDHGDLKVLGDSYSHYFVGIDLNAEWYGFDFRCFFQGVLKNDFWPDGGYFWGVRGKESEWHMRGFVQHNDYFRAEPIGLPGHEIPANLDSYFPRPLLKYAGGGKNQQVQSRYMQNAAYLRLKNLQLGYTLPSAWMERIDIKKCRLFVSGENLVTFTSIFDVFDPETAKGGNGGNVYPLSKVWSFGLSLTF